LASSIESCVYHKNGHVETMIELFVDNEINYSTNGTKLVHMLQYLHKHLEVTQGINNYYVGLSCIIIIKTKVYSSTNNGT